MLFSNAWLIATFTALVMAAGCDANQNLPGSTDKEVPAFQGEQLAGGGEGNASPAVDQTTLSAATLSASHVKLDKQVKGSSKVQPMTQAEILELGDVFFERVLTTKSRPISLQDVETAIQPDPTKRRTFVVHEAIAKSEASGHRRAVVAFTGNSLEPNVMLSVAFTPERFAPSSIEAWGWDQKRGRYNYYKLDGVGDALSWKFRGSSNDADTKSPSERSNTCLECHINGAPIMKELARPWTNWVSFDSPELRYLRSASSADVRWPSAESPFLIGKRLVGAESLEIDHLLPAIRQFNSSRLKTIKAAGEVSDGHRVLLPLFDHTEINLISSEQKSGLHPHTPGPKTGPGIDVVIPGTLLLNMGLLAPEGLTGLRGLGIVEAQALGKLKVTSAEYTTLVGIKKLRLGRHSGDADFAFFTVERAFVDDDFVDRLLKAGLVSPDYVAAILAVDLETPVFSVERASLLKFVPKSFKDAKDLKTKTLANLDRENPAAGSAAHLFQTRLKSGQAVEALRRDVSDLVARIKGALSGGGEKRAEEVERLFMLAVERRRAMKNDQTLKNLDEGGENGLLPLPRN